MANRWWQTPNRKWFTLEGIGEMGVRLSNTSEPVDRCRLHTVRHMEDGIEVVVGPHSNSNWWRRNVNLWCPRSSLGRRSCKRSGCCAKLPMLEEVES